MHIKNYLEKLLAKADLSAHEMTALMLACMSGNLSDCQIAAILVLLRAKGETVEELTAAANVMLQLSKPIDLGSSLIDIVGTGGDGKNTFNISTVSSIVAAAAGANVAKHGNRSVSGRSGSADLLQQANIALELNTTQLSECMHRFNLCFLFAPHFHPAMHYARQARQELGIRTIFNLIGPLVNPARVKRQVVGVYDRLWQKKLAQVLVNLGSERVLTVCSDDGMDEISIAAPTQVFEYHQGAFQEWLIKPEEYDCRHLNLDAILVQSPQESFMLMMSVLNGTKGAARDIVLLNTAAALYCAGLTQDFAAAVQKAADTIDNGAALARLQQLQLFSQTLL